MARVYIRSSQNLASGALPRRPHKGRCPFEPSPLTGQRNHRLTLRK
ncbi:hypothetical protein A2U01_0115828, partial [Trifolium medium]|nr:hypothetical protein [Trifolium medium]